MPKKTSRNRLPRAIIASRNWRYASLELDWDEAVWEQAWHHFLLRAKHGIAPANKLPADAGCWKESDRHTDEYSPEEEDWDEAAWEQAWHHHLSR